MKINLETDNCHSIHSIQFGSLSTALKFQVKTTEEQSGQVTEIGRVATPQNDPNFARFAHSFSLLSLY